jgi:hypothetical protein
MNLIHNKKMMFPFQPFQPTPIFSFPISKTCFRVFSFKEIKKFHVQAHGETVFDIAAYKLPFWLFPPTQERKLEIMLFFNILMNNLANEMKRNCAAVGTGRESERAIINLDFID